MKKLIFITMLALLMAFCAGCGDDKAPITSEEFSALCEKSGYVITDVTEQYSEYDYIEKASLAQKSGSYQIEFYELENEDYAKGMYELNKSNFESVSGNASAETSVSANNHSKYTCTKAGYYMCVSQIDNTMMYVKIPNTYKDNVKEMMDELGY